MACGGFEHEQQEDVNSNRLVALEDASYSVNINGVSHSHPSKGPCCPSPD